MLDSWPRKPCDAWQRRKGPHILFSFLSWINSFSPNKGLKLMVNTFRRKRKLAKDKGNTHPASLSRSRKAWNFLNDFSMLSRTASSSRALTAGGPEAARASDREKLAFRSRAFSNSYWGETGIKNKHQLLMYQKHHLFTWKVCLILNICEEMY